MSLEKIHAGFASERDVLKKEWVVVGPNDNASLNGYVRVWLSDGTTTLLSQVECQQHGVALPGTETAQEPEVNSEAPKLEEPQV